MYYFKTILLGILFIAPLYIAMYLVIEGKIPYEDESEYAFEKCVNTGKCEYKIDD